MRLHLLVITGVTLRKPHQHQCPECKLEKNNTNGHAKIYKNKNSKGVNQELEVTEECWEWEK